MTKLVACDVSQSLGELGSCPPARDACPRGRRPLADAPLEQCLHRELFDAQSDASKDVGKRSHVELVVDQPPGDVEAQLGMSNLVGGGVAGRLDHRGRRPHAREFCGKPRECRHRSRLHPSTLQPVFRCSGPSTDSGWAGSDDRRQDLLAVDKERTPRGSAAVLVPADHIPAHFRDVIGTAGAFVSPGSVDHVVHGVEASTGGRSTELELRTLGGPVPHRALFGGL